VLQGATLYTRNLLLSTITIIHSTAMPYPDGVAYKPCVCISACMKVIVCSVIVRRPLPSRTVYDRLFSHPTSLYSVYTQQNFSLPSFP